MPKTSFVHLTSFFPHEQDDAFAVLMQMQSLITEIVPIRGTAVLRNRVQRAVARLADCLIESASGVPPGRRERLHEIAVLSCRRIAGFLRLLRAAAVLNIHQHERQRAVVKQITEMLTRRLLSLIGSQQVSHGRAPDTEQGIGSATGATETNLPNSPQLESPPSPAVAEPAAEQQQQQQQ